ncbi:Hpt domain-containing protein [Planctomicrobium piriforme]|uniref:HPt (Histidine-containing phosphotransfer) domain-containing protein n=1 Tax=Planctomicrobium piriforme TaxID=1576369 RepID=A0A1I3PGG6_9PLAN|nr:Hpt domain-containing protein [Planctomicrobium piriforme]SFJ20430.1 HPt (histidine-containing phosphotransfer) domain-containing protein [Planctomicrobium piriforme]
MSNLPPMQESEPVIDLQPALARLGNDAGLLRDLAYFYLEDGVTLLNEVARGLEEQDAELVTRSAHSLKGLSANFDAHQAVAVSLEVEQLGKREDLSAAAAAYSRLRESVEQVMQALQEDVLK